MEVAEVSGRGVVQSYTTNFQQWSADYPRALLVAVVAIEEDPRIRLTTNIVGCAPDDVVVGMRVRVALRARRRCLAALFEPTGEPPAALPDERDELERIRSVRPMARMEKFEDTVALTGIGMSRIGRKLMVDPVSLTVEAIRTAVADAGLTLDDIDGLSTYPAGGADGGYSEGGVDRRRVGTRPPTRPGTTGARDAGRDGVAHRGHAGRVAAGLCRHVVCFRTVWQSTYAELAERGRRPA